MKKFIIVEKQSPIGSPDYDQEVSRMEIPLDAVPITRSEMHDLMLRMANKVEKKGWINAKDLDDLLNSTHGVKVK